jgi:membrane protein implicated in regulation of membrane protease activity
MRLYEPRARIAHRATGISRAKQLALKTFVVLGGAVMVASAFVVSLVFVAIAFAIVLIFGGYLWWKTRELRRQLRAEMQRQQQPSGEVIEGEVIPLERTRRYK